MHETQMTDPTPRAKALADKARLLIARSSDTPYRTVHREWFAEVALNLSCPDGHCGACLTCLNAEHEQIEVMHSRALHEAIELRGELTAVTAERDALKHELKQALIDLEGCRYEFDLLAAERDRLRQAQTEKERL